MDFTKEILSFTKEKSVSIEVIGDSEDDCFSQAMKIKSLNKNDKQKIAVITHAGNIRSFLSFILGIPLENSFRIQLNYACIIRAEINDNPKYNKLYWL